MPRAQHRPQGTVIIKLKLSAIRFLIIHSGWEGQRGWTRWNGMGFDIESAVRMVLRSVRVVQTTDICAMQK